MPLKLKIQNSPSQSNNIITSISPESSPTQLPESSVSMTPQLTESSMLPNPSMLLNTSISPKSSMLPNPSISPESSILPNPSTLPNTSIAPLFKPNYNNIAAQQLQMLQQTGTIKRTETPGLEGLNTPTYALLIGRVISVDRHLKGHFRVHTISLDKDFYCIYSGFFPIHEGDVIEGTCRVVNHPKYGQQLIFDRPPIAQIAMDKDSILRCMIKVLRGTGFGNIKAFNLYDQFLDRAGSSDKVTGYISELAAMWHDHQDDTLLSVYSTCVTPKQLQTLLDWWYKHQSLRRLYLLGLNNREIRDIHLPLDVIYQRCMTNPYTLVPLSLEKCDDIFTRRNVTPSAEDRECAIIVRKIYDFMINKGWVGIPSKILSSLFPNATALIPKLKTEYEIATELFTIYLPYPYKIEVGVASIIDRLVTKNQNLNSSVDTHFQRSNLTDDQQQAIQGALDHKICIITGAAGTGKTTIISEIIYNLELREISYMVVSFTGKAVARLREVIRRKSPATMHRLIARSHLTPKFQHLIIDEASMVTTSLFYEFISTFSYDYKVTLVGDANQLEPIGWGALFDQLIMSGQIPVYRLTHVHRIIGQNNGILLNANKMIEYSTGDMEELPPFDFEVTDNFQIESGTIESVYDIIKALHNCGVTLDKVTIVTPYNKDLDQLNKIYQQIYNDGHKYVVDSRGIVWMLKDRVSLRENRYDINVMNGEEGLITDLSDETILVTFRDGAQYAFKLEPANTHSKYYKDDEEEERDHDATEELTVLLLRHSFALTTHLAQGSEWDFVIIYIPENTANSRFLNRRLIYTALTRAKLALWCIGDVVSLNLSAIRPPAYRCDNLAMRLKHQGVQVDFTPEDQSSVIQDVSL